ncbi:SDR family NAD(P)-dependent oxidoreductase [Kurthia sibirica]|uniref:Short-chain dehydrogenase n=1 Tax=Kurthia sibirica TaxID=202750 RepID=A0A2U3AQG9_9BACL|nr:SDR family NAD(P)-dependent oxidoreductase [Kurthia sibirica]PWI26774.1 short-chain dehydrogenase [Kurthia sibirica]GEK32693.1 short-chain dehydrogenase [Kurthia sibirica]
MNLGLLGKTAIVTGGSRGIGFAVALQLVIEGANVVICGRHEDALKDAANKIEKETQQRVLAIVADVSSKADCEKLIKSTVAKHNRIDILINNAGMSSTNSFMDISTRQWTEDLDLKLFGAINCSEAAVPHMEATGGGSIVNVTAISGKSSTAGTMPTSVSRAAGIALTNTMSKDLGPLSIRVNAVCIGLIRSTQIERKWKKEQALMEWEDYSLLAAEQIPIPLGRIGEASEAANAIVFLASEAASYISGTALNIDGGTSPVV